MLKPMNSSSGALNYVALAAHALMDRLGAVDIVTATALSVSGISVRRVR
jgi:hypothetical protein